MRNFFPFGLALVLVLFGAMALSHVPKGVTASDDVSIGRLASLNQASTVPANHYQVSGDRQGKVTVRDAASGEVIRTFEMDSGVVVRETFLLDNGRTIAASQKDHAVFWDLATGKEIHRFPARIYGFSHDETKFFTYNNREIFIYAYPAMMPICQLTKGPQSGPGDFRFSPNDRFLVIGFYSGFPSDDENYPKPNPVLSRGIISVKLFNIQTCKEIEEFFKLRLRIHWFDDFSADSKFLYVRLDGSALSEESQSWRFNLTTYELEKIAE